MNTDIKERDDSFIHLHHHNIKKREDFDELSIAANLDENISHATIGTVFLVLVSELYTT